MWHSESVPNIHITEVRVHQLTGKLEERFGWSRNWAYERQCTLVEVATDAGLTGWGDGGYGGDWLVENPGLVIGRSPFEVEAIHEELRAPGGFQERSRPRRTAGLIPLCGTWWGRHWVCLFRRCSDGGTGIGCSHTAPLCTGKTGRTWRRGWPRRPGVGRRPDSA